MSILAKLKIPGFDSDLSGALKAALDVCQANVMMADPGFKILYLNESLRRMLKMNEKEIQEHLPAFRVDALIGTNIDVFHKKPSHQRQIVNSLTAPYNTKIRIGRLTFDLIATPVFDSRGKRLGTVVEWQDMTEELARREEERRINNENLRIRDALDNIDTCVMIADASNDIIYLNQSIQVMLKQAEASIRQRFPSFSADNLIGKNMDLFHKNPAHQQGVVSALTEPHAVEIQIGDRFFRLTASPVIDSEGARIGTVVEWLDRTAELATEAEIASVVEAAARGYFDRKISEEGMEGFSLQMAKGLNRLIQTTDDGLNDIARVLGAIAKRDLTARVTTDYSGKFQELKDYCNETAESLTRMIAEIREAGSSIALAAKEIAQGNTDLSSRTEEQASSLEETASSMEELTSTVKQNADSAKQANTLSDQAAKVASGGNELVERVVTTMGEISSSSREIEDIIGVIDGIAFQTNILALNAAVEAARAGDQGRGFAVVASEVRSLAQRSASAAKDIKQLISDSVGKIEVGDDLVKRAGRTMQEILESVQRVRDLNSEIAAASEEQASGINNVSVAVSQMDEMTQQNAALVEQAAAAAESQQEQVEQLNSLVMKFRLDTNSLTAVEAPPSNPPRLNSPSDSGGSSRQRPSSTLPASQSGPEDDWDEF